MSLQVIDVKLKADKTRVRPNEPVNFTITTKLSNAPTTDDINKHILRHNIFVNDKIDKIIDKLLESTDTYNHGFTKAFSRTGRYRIKTDTNILKWLVKWKYRVKHDIVGSSSGDVTNYPVKFRIINKSVWAELFTRVEGKGIHEAVAYAVVDKYLYWGYNWLSDADGDIYKTDLETGETTLIYSGRYRAEWQGIKVGDKIILVGQELDPNETTQSPQTMRSTIHIIDTTTDTVTPVYVPNTDGLNEFVSVDTDGKVLLIGERDAPAQNIERNTAYPNSGGIWVVPLDSLTDTSKWKRVHEEPNYEVSFIAYWNNKWYALCQYVHHAGGKWKLISTTDFENWTTELDYTSNNFDVRVGGGLAKAGDKLVVVNAVQDTGTYHMFVYDGKKWTDYDLGLDATVERWVKIFYLPNKNKLVLIVVDPNAYRSDIYTVNLDGSELKLEQTIYNYIIGKPHPDQLKHVYYKGATFIGNVVSSGTAGITKIYVDNGDEVVLTDHQAKTDFSDIRFTDEDGVTELSYAIQEKTEDYAIVWVKIPHIPQNFRKTIYIYYGNSNATDKSDPANVFTYYDDFDGTSLGSQYVKINGDEQVSLSNSILSITNPTGNVPTGLYIFQDFGTNYRIIVKARENPNLSPTTGHKTFGVFARFTDANNFYRLWVQDDDGGGTWRKVLSKKVSGTVSDLVVLDDGVDVKVGEWHIIELGVFEDKLKGLIIRPDGKKLVFEATDLDLQTGKAGIVAGFSANNTMDYDYIIITPFIYPEPQHDIYYSKEQTYLE